MSVILPAISALGTTWYVEIFDNTTTEKADETHRLISFFLTSFEDTYSRFKPNSILSKLNQTKQLQNPDTTTIELLKLGQQFYQDTEGVFNILLAEHLIARGYDQDYSFQPIPEPQLFPSPLTDLTITETEITLHRGQLDLGGFGKGFLIDQLACYISSLGFSYFLINGGGDMYATSNFGEPILIYLEDPNTPGTYVGTTTIINQGFAASSTNKRRWKVAGMEYSHIVNTTNQNDLHADSTFITAPTAVEADVWATTLLISDPASHQEELLRKHINCISL